MINTITPILRLLAQDAVIEMAAEGDSTQSFLCGISPASIRAIRSKKYNKTLIATREFESRLKAIFKTCDNRILELYVDNLNKNLWEIDQMAAVLLGSSHEQYQRFLEFASYKQTTVSLTDKKAKMLANYYKVSKQKIEEEILGLKKELLEEKKLIG